MRRTLIALATSAAALGLLAAPASARTTQDGLVNVNLEDVTVQVPVAAAVNLCDVSVAVLAEMIDAGGACDAVAQSDAERDRRGPSHVHQDGLVNVNVNDVVIQVPVAVAANICDVTVGVLAGIVDVGGSCDAHAGSDATA